MLHASLLLWGALAARAPSPDSAQAARFQAAVDASAESLDHLRGITAASVLDLEHASDALVFERAGRLRDACAATGAAIAPLQRLLGAESLSPQSAVAQRRLRAAVAELRPALLRCEADWAPDPLSAARANTVRAWGRFRAGQIDRQLQSFSAALREFQHVGRLQHSSIG
jgi:hypothetical protein